MLSFALCSALAGPVPVAMAEDTAATSNSLKINHALQQLKFGGSLAIEGDTVEGGDVLTFEDGVFSSRTCVRYGFSAAPYWVRRDTEGLHFRATLHSPADGTILFEGVFDGEQMRATAHWTKERWYWTVEQKLEFAGRVLRQAE